MLVHSLNMSDNVRMTMKVNVAKWLALLLSLQEVPA